MNRPHAPALPAANRRRTSGAQDGANGAAPSEAGLGKAGAQTRAGGFPPLPPPAALPHWRPTGPRPTPAAALQPPRHEYTPGGRAGDNGWQADARQGGGAEGGGAAYPPPPPPAPPPQLEGHRSDPPPPRSRGDAPPPPERGGGGAAGPAHRAPQCPQPPAPVGVAADGGAHTGTPERRADQAWGRRTPAHQNSMGAAPPMTPPMTIAWSGRAEGRFRSEGAPGGAVPPPPRGGPATPTERARRGGVRRRQEGGHGREPRREPPPTPPTGPQAAGAPPPPPEAGGMVPPPLARERSQSKARPPAPAAGSHRNHGKQASPRQHARTPHRSRPEKAGEHEPEWYGDHAPHEQNDAGDTRFVACPGKAEG